MLFSYDIIGRDVTFYKSCESPEWQNVPEKEGIVGTTVAVISDA